MLGALNYLTDIKAAARRTGVPESVIAATLANELDAGWMQNLKDAVAKRVKSPKEVSTGIGQIKPRAARAADEGCGRQTVSDEEYRKKLMDPAMPTTA